MKKPNNKGKMKLHLTKKGVNEELKEIKINFDDIKDKLINEKIELPIMEMMNLMMNLATLSTQTETNTKKQTRDHIAKIGQQVSNLMKEKMEEVMLSHLQEKETNSKTPQELSYIG